MAGTATPIFVQTVKNYVAQILPADTTTVKTLVAGATNGTKVEALIVSSSDTTARDVQITLTISSVVYILCTIQIPITAGIIDSVPSIDILRNAQIPGLAYDSNGNKCLLVASGSTLGINCLTTVTTAKAIQAIAIAGDF